MPQITRWLRLGLWKAARKAFPSALAVAAALGVSIASPTGAWGTSFIQRPFQNTVSDAEQIVRGKIGASSVDWSKNEPSRRLYTYYQLQVDEVLKGKTPSQSIQIRVLGGEKDGVGMQVAGAAKFERGEDVVVLLSDPNAEGSYDVRGLMMGKLNVSKDPSGDEVLSGPALVEGPHPGHGADTGQSDTSPPKKWTIDSLRQLIKTQASAGPDAKTISNPNARPSSSAASPHPSEASPKAPQLQPSSDQPSASNLGDESGGRRGISWIWLALGGVALASVLIFAFSKIRKS